MILFTNPTMKNLMSNVKLFERQVEFDNARLQKGEITLVVSSIRIMLAGANADLIKAKTDFSFWSALKE